MSSANIIKLSQIVRELWSAKYFGFRRDKYIAKKVRVVSLAQRLDRVDINQCVKNYKNIPSGLSAMTFFAN